MNRNYRIGFAAAAVVLGLLVFAAWSFLEIYPRTRHLPPSPEARANNYLALDRWLDTMGIPVRAESSGDLALVSRAEEKKIFIQASLFSWTGEAAEYFSAWIEKGGHLIIVLDNYEIPSNRYQSYRHYRGEEDEYLLLLEDFGIKAEIDADNPDSESGSGSSSAEAPDYDPELSFEVSADEDGLFLRDWTGLARLVEVNRGKGKLTVMGNPRFLFSDSIGEAPNTRLAWALFADGSESAGQNGWLFIRGTARIRGLLGTLFRQGNLTVLLVSLLALLVIGFWTAIPVFGLVRGGDEKNGKSLRERFLAEGRFLKRYDALEFYCAVYLKDIRRKLARNVPALQTAEADTLSARLLEIWEAPPPMNPSGGNPRKFYSSAKRDRNLLAGFLSGKPVSYRNFPRMIEILKTIMERI